jgi:hypothetical protein
MSKLAVILLAIVPICAQEPHKFVFPSDTKTPKQVATLVTEALKSVCPAQLSIDEKIACRPCPDFTSSPGNTEGATITGALRGHFLSPESDDLLLDTLGCGPAIGPGGAVLLTLQSGKWKMIRYENGFGMGICHKVALSSGRDLPLCVEDAYTHGILFNHLSLWDISPESSSKTRLLTTSDDSGTCGNGWLSPKPDQSGLVSVGREYIERIDFHPNGSDPGTMTVTVQRGTKGITPDEREACAKGSWKRDPTRVSVKATRTIFAWDGTTFRQIPSPHLQPGTR